MNKKKILILSKRKIEEMMTCRTNSLEFAIVSITSSIETIASIAPQGPIIRVTFDDVDDIDNLPDAKLITKDQAKAIADFLKHADADPEISTIIFQCGAGISRSSGAAAAFCAATEGYSDAWIFSSCFYSPNMCVYRLILQALQNN